MTATNDIPPEVAALLEADRELTIEEIRLLNFWADEMFFAMIWPHITSPRSRL